jgi:hypothetical protein
LASKKDRLAQQEKGRLANPNVPRSAPRRWRTAAVDWRRGRLGAVAAHLRHKSYWSTRIYANINGTWQMAESYHTYIKDAPVMAPVPQTAGRTN